MRLLVTIALIGLFASPATAEDWPRWRGMRGDGSWNGPALPADWSASQAKIRWKLPINGGYAGVSVAAGRVYTMDGYRKLTGKDRPAAGKSDGQERILCFDADTGKLLWEHAYAVAYGPLGGYSNGPRSAPTVHDGKVYTLGAVGHLFGFDAITGKIVWSHDLVGKFQARVPEWGFAASPVIDGERVIVHVGAEPNGCLLAFDRQTGKEIWRSLDDPAGYNTPILIDAPAGRQLVIWTPENVHGLDPATGKSLWSVPYKVTYGVSIATPIYRDGLVFVTGYWEGSKAIRLGPQATASEVVWENNKYLRGLMAQPLYRDGLVYTIDKSLGLVCADLKTGAKRWDNHSMMARGRNPHASIVWLGDSDEVLLVNAEGELIHARLTPAGYQEKSRARITTAGVWGHPAFAGSRVYLKSDGGENYRKGPYELIAVDLLP